MQGRRERSYSGIWTRPRTQQRAAERSRPTQLLIVGALLTSADARRRTPDDLQPPCRAGCEQRVRVQLVGPAEEVRLRVVLGRAVQRRPLRLEPPVEVVAALERSHPLLDC